MAPEMMRNTTNLPADRAQRCSVQANGRCVLLPLSQLMLPRWEENSEGCEQMRKQTVVAENGKDMAPELRRRLDH
jgi:hypothetical protein